MLVTLQLLLAILTLLMLVQDLVPLGRWNALDRLAAESPLAHRLRMTAINTTTAAAALFCTLSPRFLQMSWQHTAATIILALFLVGAFLSWWKPWLFGSTADEREKLRKITDGTYAFVPQRNGVTPNALHCLFHLIAVAAFALDLNL